jgi:alkanesulfonate monooxygenase SsuD/methylene tetrahydromethanopterin reductase-like flavin-dependent oxidoreductase (luciferase family)
MMNQYPMSRESLSEKFDWYKEAYAKAGHDEADRQAMVCFMAYITDTEEKAIEGARGPLQEHAGAFRKLMLGDQWNRDYEADESVLRAMCDSDDIRDVFRKRTLICTPEQAAERIAGYLDEGFTEICLTSRYAGITPEQEHETLERMTNEVVPMLGRTLNHANIRAAQ